MGTLEPVDAGQARTLTDRIKVAVEGTWHLIQEAYMSRAWAALGYSSWDDYCTREFGTSRLRLPREERQEVVASLREIGMSTRAIASATGHNRETVMNDLHQVVGNQPPAQGVGNPTPERLGQIDPAAQRDGQSLAATGEISQSETRVGGDGRQTRPPSLADPFSHADPGADEPHPPASQPVTGTDGKNYPTSPKQKPPTPRGSQRGPLRDEANKLSLDLGRFTNRVNAVAGDNRLRNHADRLHDLRNTLRLHIEACQALHSQLPQPTRPTAPEETPK